MKRLISKKQLRSCTSPKMNSVPGHAQDGLKQPSLGKDGSFFTPILSSIWKPSMLPLGRL